MKKLKDNKVFLFPVILILISLVMLPLLPDEIPMQFQMDGEVSWYLSKYLAIWIIPAVECLLILRYRNMEKNKIYVILALLTIVPCILGIFVMLA